MANITYYLIREKRLGKKEDDRYYLYKNREWVPDDSNVLMDHLMGYDPNDETSFGFGSMSIFDEIEEITEEEAVKFENEQIIDYLKEKWKNDIVLEKEEWDKNPGWPAKLVETRFTLNGIKYVIGPRDLGLEDDCWDQGFMESFQGTLRKDLEANGAIEVYNLGFLD